MKRTYRKSCAANLLMLSDLTLSNEDSKTVLITRLSLVLDVWDGKPTYRN